MNRIYELDSDLVNKIAAGEVIDSSFSVIKELVENSIDANSTEIEIETKDAGLTSITVSDNGTGIEEEDLILSVKRHATSKIQKQKDLESILTYGFRGEALASISSVSKMNITTGTTEDKTASSVYVESGVILNLKQVTGRKGTKIEVLDLFYNTPVRRKFIKSERSEERKLKERVSICGLSNHNIALKFVQNEKLVYNLKPESHLDRIGSIFGESIKAHLLETKLEWTGLKAFGYISDPDYYKSNRSGQYFFVNNRPIEIKYSSYILKKCYDELLPSNAHPYCFLYFEIDPSKIDVNVHPTKKEIRFLNEDHFQSFFYSLVNTTLRSKTPVSFLEMKKRMSSATQTNKETIFQPEKDNSESLLHNLYTEVTSQAPFNLQDVSAGTKLETLTNTYKQSREFLPKKHYGIIFETYILAEAEDGLYIIDQHTAHERIRYEEILKKLRETKISTQGLLTPIRFEVSRHDLDEILDRMEEFSQVGIQLDTMGDTTILIREVPDFIETGAEKEIVLDFLNRTRGKKGDITELYDLLAKSIACRFAIKKGDHLSPSIISEIVNRLSYCEHPTLCPHGRPTLIKLTKNELDKMFHRI